MPVSDDLWFKDSVFYQLHVKSFFDGDDDGIGDFRGLTRRLDYLRELGVDTLWLLPFYPSPLRDDGYDIAEYRQVHADYGNLRDFRRFVREAHARGLRVVTELVINHTSDQHPWFQRARRAAPGSAARRFYVWSDTYERYLGTRIIFTDTEKSNWQWDDDAGAYYWHRFFSHQPDLNFANPRVEREMVAVMRFWLDLGVDGMRLDAVPYLCERDGTNNENLPETHAVLKRLRGALDASHPGRLFLAEANQWPEDVVAYFGDGDECHMAFHFPLMPRMFMAIAREDRHPITDILRQTPEIPSNCQWAVFLRNHDELTLEMVTDRERDYLWQTYAKDMRARLNIGIRRRLAPLMDNDRQKMELMNSLLMSMPGTPIIYYGDELGMGDNIFLGDRNGVRTPMQWSDARNGGFSRADPSRLFLPAIMDPVYGYQTVNVEAQSRSPSSLLNWMRRLIHVRRSRKAFGRGALSFLYPANRRILAYLREHEGESILCIANLSHSVQGAELDLSAFEGRVPVELRGESALPPIGRLPYFLTLPPYGFYWFLLARDQAAPDWHERPGAAVPELQTLVMPQASLAALSVDAVRRPLESAILPRYLPLQRWYGDKAGQAAGVGLDTAAMLPDGEGGGWPLATLRVGTRLYFLPLAGLWGKAGEDFAASGNPAVLARLRCGPRVGALFDGAADDGLILALAAAITGSRRFTSGDLCIEGFRTDALDGVPGGGESVSRVAAEQSNSSLVIGESAILKLIRRPDDGPCVEAEIGAFLTARGFPFSPPLLGGVTIGDGDGRRLTVALMHGYLANQGDAWSWTTRQLERVLDQMSLLPATEAKGRLAAGDADLSRFIEVLGHRTGALHTVLGQVTGNDDFDPEPISDADLAAWRRRALDQAEAALRAAGNGTASSSALAGHAALLRDAIGEAVPDRVTAAKSRIHGDYHLGQVLVVGNDVAIIDFEGEPTRPWSERRARDCPLRDVAGMLRSFDYAMAALLARAEAARPGARRSLAPMAGEWLGLAARQFLGSYILATEGLSTLPGDADVFRRLLRLFLLEKACYEICYEAAHRPAWREVPVQGILDLLGIRLEEG